MRARFNWENAYNESVETAKKFIILFSSMKDILKDRVGGSLGVGGGDSKKALDKLCAPIDLDPLVGNEDLLDRLSMLASFEGRVITICSEKTGTERQKALESLIPVRNVLLKSVCSKSDWDYVRQNLLNRT